MDNDIFEFGKKYEVGTFVGDVYRGENLEEHVYAFRVKHGWIDGYVMNYVHVSDYGFIEEILEESSVSLQNKTLILRIFREIRKKSPAPGTYTGKLFIDAEGFETLIQSMPEEGRAKFKRIKKFGTERGEIEIIITNDIDSEFKMEFEEVV